MAERLVVEWTRGSVRVAHAHGRRSRWQLRGFYSRPVPQPSDMQAALRDLIESERLPSTRHVVSIVPREHVITRMVRFPTVDAAELRQMVDLYAKSQLPYSREETVINFDWLDRQEGFSIVNVVACQREVIERQMNLLEGVNLSAEAITVSSWGVLGWYRQLAQSQEINEPVLVVHLDKTRVDLLIIAEGQLLASRSLGQGVEDWRGTEPAQLLAVEIDRSLAALGKEFPGIGVQSVLMTGFGSLEGWSRDLQPRLRLPVLVADPLLGFEDSRGLSGAAQASPVVAGGIACADLRATLSLNPPELRRRIEKRQTVQEFATVGMLSLAAVALGAGLFGIEMLRHRQHERRIDQALEVLEPKARAVRQQKQLVDNVSDLLDERSGFARFLHNVLAALPEDFQLEMFQYEKRTGDLLVRGRAPSTDALLGLIAALENQPAIAKAQLKFSNQRFSPEGVYTAFEVNVRPAEQGGGDE